MKRVILLLLWVWMLVGISASRPLIINFGDSNSDTGGSGGPKNFSMGVRNIFKSFRPLGI
ncbi:hypothetical protein Hanom_Chr06g00487491 [Helianthus anomalus]